jgi:CRP/FNR family transcriptional regulator, cyclic AMP receptor protein
VLVQTAPTAQDVDAVRVFAEDPDLLRGLDPAATDLLRRRVTVPKLWIDAGTWQPPGADEARSWYGLLVLDGLMLRSLHLDGRACPELVGAGDLLRPWDSDTTSTMPLSVTWTALERTTVAVLDERFAVALSRWPSIASNLLGRAVERSRTLAFHLAVAHVRHADVRLRMLLWHLADRWGRVTPQGVHLPLTLTHETLAHLVCMRRPTASSALQRLRANGEIERVPDGTWLLTGEPPVAAA